jgi:arylsulfatase A-like enzyme
MAGDDDPGRRRPECLVAAMTIPIRMFVAALLVLCFCGAGAPDDRPNIVLISFDTLRADHVGAYGYRGTTTPFIDSVAARGTLFTNDLTPFTSTTPAHAAMLTSLHPFKTGSMNLAMPMATELETLPEVLRKQGYATAGATAVFHLGRAYNFAQGFDRFSDIVGAHQRGSDAVNADLVRFVDELRQLRQGGRSRPLFVFAHYFDIHAPYGWWRNAPPIDPKDLGAIGRGYDEGVRHADAAAARLWAQLEARGFTKQNTILCLTGDHGEQLGDHGVVADHADIYDETARVPLVLAGPDIAHTRSDDAASTLDVATTLLREVGAAFPKPVDGRDLFAGSRSLLGSFFGGKPAPRDRMVVGNPAYTRSISISDGRYRFIQNLENVYKELRVSKPPASAAADRKRVPLTMSGQTGSIALFLLPRGQYAPYTVTLDHTPKSGAGCTELNYALWLAPQVTYMLKPVAWSGPLRMRFSGARDDRATFVVYPAQCAGEVTARLDRYDPAADARETVMVTDLWKNLYAAPRKRIATDELFDAKDDPGMQRNLIARADLAPVAERLRGALRTQYQATIAAIPSIDPARRYSEEELKKLRSLGYIQ